MNIAMRTSQRGIEMIKQHEGLRLKAYLDPANVWTIGWGHTHRVHPGQQITLEQAQAFLAIDIAVAEDCVNRNVTVALTQSQFDALVSFVFNLGCGSLRRSTLLRHLNGGSHALASKEFTRWNKAAGRVLRGLVRRREEEQMMFRESIEEVET
jgi:lysozyme